MKLYAFDVDNTLVKLPRNHKYIWSVLNEFFDTQTEDNQLWKLYNQSKISYHEWVSQDLEMYKTRGGTKSTIYKALSDCRLFPNAEKVLDELNKKGDKVCTLSGSIDTILKKLRIKDKFHKTLINKIPFKNREIDIANIKTTGYDLKRKKEGIIKLASIFNIPLSDCVYIGDSDSDYEVCKFLKENNGISLAINTDSEKLKQACTKQIYNLEEILNLK